MHSTALVKALLFQARLTNTTLRIMKITAILLTAVCLHAGAMGYSQTVTLSAKNAPLEKVFAEIKKQTGYEFVYRWELLQNSRPVDIQVKNVSLKEALDLCMKDQFLSYSIVDNLIIINKKETGQIAVIATPLTDVKGRVVNEKGEPVAGVSVRVKGTGKGTSTDDNGEFVLTEIDANAILIISGANIETVEIKINGKTDLETLAVKTKITEGERVIINTGYEKISRERFVGSYSQLDNAAYERRAGMDIISRLDGAVTGVLFDKKSGDNSLSSIQIRGISTLNGENSPSKAPLIVVDNFPFRQDLSTINPNDVESITILRDAAAASIWGAQAGNGVIVISTKKGRYNQPLQVSVMSNVTIQEKPDPYYYPQMSVSDFINMELFLFNKGYYDANLANTTSWPILSPVVEILAKRRAGEISGADSASQIDGLKSLDLRRDLDKYAYRNAFLQQHYINLSGGNNLFNYSFSGGYNRSLNDVQNSKPDDQFTLNSNAGFRPINNLEITIGINYSEGTQKSAGFSLPGQIYPYAQLADAEGHPLALSNSRRLAYFDTAGAGNLLDWRYRPLDEPGLSERKDITRLILLNVGISYRFTSWLSASFNYQYSNQFLNNRDYSGLQTYFTRDLINQYTNLSETNPDLRYPVPRGGILDILNSELNSQNTRGQLNFNKGFGSKHQITAQVAGEISETKFEGNSNRFYAYNKESGSYKAAIDYTTSFPLYIVASGSQQVPNGSTSFPETNNRFVSFLGNFSYTYNSRYTFYASARKDGANVFGVNTNRKWKPLWSAGAGWDISKESFYDIKWMPSLRLRASYGYTGNPGNATGLPTMIYSGTLASFTNLIRGGPGNPPNPNLRWEKVGMINAGVDFNLFNSRLSGKAEVWQKKSTDVISFSPFAPSTGITSFIVNVANLRGNGFDINLNSKNIDRIFKWQTSFGISHAKTIITKLYNDTHSAKDFVDYGLHAAEGKLAYGIASYRWAGLDPLTGDPQGYFSKQVSKNYAAIINDSVGNQVFHGSAIPLYFGFIGNSFSWKNFSLSANISYRLDFYFRKPTINYTTLVNGWQGHADYALRWQKQGDEKYTNVPSFIYPLNSNRDYFYQYSEINVLRGDNIRLQDVRLQYNWENRNQKRLAFKNLQVFVYANNLNVILWRKNKSNLDPDFVGGTSFFVPESRTWTGGINLNF
jgi:TonB-dependent starch-binding outer membrane protein SusC